MSEATTYPGRRLGLPENGSGSVATWLARFGALVIDWLASMLVASVIAGQSMWSQDAPVWPTPLVFLVEVSLFTALAGGSFGQIPLRLAVVHVEGRKPLNLLQALLRAVLTLLVVPPLVFNSDNRGLHDLAVGSVVVKR